MGMLYLHNNILLTDTTGIGRLKFGYIIPRALG